MPDRQADTPYFIELCERMRMARIHADITMEAVAHTLGMPHQRISKMERGDVRPRADVVAAYAAMFEVDPGWLLCGDEPLIDVVAPEGKSKFMAEPGTVRGRVVQPAEKKVRAKIKKKPPPAPRPPEDPAKLWRPSAWQGRPDRRTIEMSSQGR